MEVFSVVIGWLLLVGGALGFCYLAFAVVRLVISLFGDRSQPRHQPRGFDVVLDGVPQPCPEETKDRRFIQ